jgi:hypothetical protein
MKASGLILTLLVILSFNARAQKFDLGKVSVEELKEKSHPSDTSAAAAILFRKGETTFDYSDRDGFIITTTVKTRIKIYKKDGYDWATTAVRYYYPTAHRESVSFSDAYTYNLVDGKIVKTKLKSDGQFEEKINQYWNVKKITMPAVQEGSVIEYEYTLTSPDWNIRDWQFQTSIPVNYSEYVTIVPEYFVYKTNVKGSIAPKITTAAQSKSITLQSKERSGGSGPVKTTFSQQQVNYIANKSTYICSNLPAMKDEAFVNNIANYTSTLSLELSMTHFPNSTMKKYSIDWESLTKTIYDNDDFGGELDKTGYFESDLNSLLNGVTGTERVNKIFDFVKNKVKWNGFVGYSCNDGVRKAYKDGTGNVAEINLMLTAMLRHAGFNAHPVLTSTRSNGVALYPNRTAYNYVIAAIESSEGTILLDATEPYASPNVLPTRVLNWFGRLIRKDRSSMQIDLMPVVPSKEVVNVQYTLSPTGDLSGKVRKQITGNNALEFRSDYLAMDKEAYLEKLENRNNKIEISDYSRDKEFDITQPLSESYSFTQSGAVDIMGGKMYLAPLLFLAEPENPFKQETREYPIDFSYPREYRYNVNIQIPEGYAIESIPASLSLGLDNKVTAFKYIAGEQGDKIQISFNLNLNEAILSSNYYPALKDCFQQMVDKHAEKIILRKL